MNFVVMPVHVGLSMTRAAVESVLAQDIPVKMFVVANGVTDGTQAYLHSLPPKLVTVIHYQPQKGVSYAWNKALAYCFGTGAEACLVVNNDIVLRKDSYRLLLEDGGEFVTCVGSSDPHCVDPVETNVISKPYTKELPTLVPVYAVPDPDCRRPHPDMSCYLIRRTCWEKVGPFDEMMVSWASDGDYHLRMHKAGIHAYCLDLPFYHRASGTLKELPAPEQAVLLNQAQRDRETFEKKWGFRMGSLEYYEVFGHGRPDDPGAARD